MKIIIDADGCPVIKITLDIAKLENIPVLLVSNTSHVFNLENYKNSIHILADKGKDNADFLIINKVNKGDIVITQDYALASMCLAKNTHPINQNGFLYTPENIDELLFRRHMGQKLRKIGKNSFKPKKRNKDNDDKFKKSLLNLINVLKNQN